MLGSIVSFFIVDRYPRKHLLFYSLICLGLSQLTLGFVVKLSSSFNAIISLISLNLFIYEATVAPLYWVYAPELMKLEDFSRNQVVYWSFTCVISLICYLAPSSSSAYIIWSFALMCFFLACGVWYFMIETRNKMWDEKYSRTVDIQKEAFDTISSWNS